MRVEILSNAGIPEPLPLASENRALQAFLASVNSGDSLFRVTPCSIKRVLPSSAGGMHFFSGSALLTFSEDAYNSDRGLYYRLVGKLNELLKEAGSADSLEVKLGLSLQLGTESPVSKNVLAIELIARGSSPEQAEIRWGFGVAHLQQALLFTSRFLRQQFSGRKG